MRILMIDDDEDIREVTVLILEANGHQVRAEASGVGALRALQDGSALPELILLDLMMPVVDGEAFLKEMRVHPELAGIPVVIISGHHDGKARARQLGAVSCLVKPIELTELLRCVDLAGAPHAADARE